ncbi:TetR/AcrR family transcriptional regulator [Peribacillus tepidiphilus]|uniref:TetR/AcrR family transcriptional regulator n=1 Tax=Peribacillus tepidiphilus TaxID=2652445 RepID=UPI0012914221|nr:TetR/AcrR family transcriptional regulator [Peribacillus tepidiphilus]
MTKKDSLEEWLMNTEDDSLTDKQKKIIEAAIEIFAEKGYAAASTNEIAKKAGVAEGTIFRHYKTKKDLLLSIVAPSMARLIAPFVIKDIYKVLDGKYEKMEDFFHAMLKNRREFLKNNIAIFRILIQEIPFHTELKEQFMEHIAKKIYARFEQIVIHYQEKGEIINIPPLSVIRFVISVFLGFLLARYLVFPDIEWDDEAEDERTIQLIMHGLSSRSAEEKGAD